MKGRIIKINLNVMGFEQAAAEVGVDATALSSTFAAGGILRNGGYVRSVNRTRSRSVSTGYEIERKRKDA